jgi:IS4 transposase
MATEIIRKKLRAKASRNQKKLKPATPMAAEFLMVVTSLPAANFPANEVLTAYRLRWRIELAFKRLKSLPHIDRMPTHPTRASQSWLYAHLYWPCCVTI